jgi:hypothetical protein
MVLVNPGEISQQFMLDGTYYRYAFTGGGLVPNDTKPTMTLTHSTAMSGTITVAPHTALILWKE